MAISHSKVGEPFCDRTGEKAWVAVQMAIRVRVSKSACKVMCITFCDTTEVISNMLNHLVPPKTIATSHCYATWLKSDLYTSMNTKHQELI